MSRLIKSSNLQELTREKVSIKIAPIFADKRADVSETNKLSIDLINKMLQEAKESANQIVEQAAAEKEKVLIQLEKETNGWETKKKQLSEQAYLEGHENGLQAGKQEALAQWEENIKKSKQLLEQAVIEHDKKVASSIETIITISIKVAEKIIGQAIEKDAAVFTKMVQTALKEVKEKEEIKIFVCPEQYQFLVDQKHHLQNILNSQYELYIFPEAELSEGGCWIDSSAGRMEVSVQVQLSEIKKKLLEVVKLGACS